MSTQSTPIAEILEDLVDDIEAGGCILLLGPEVIRFEGKSLRRHVHEQLLRRHGEHIDYYYEKEDLFFFEEGADKIKVAREIKKIYRELPHSDKIYKKILEIPLPLIISLNEDTYLAETARQYQLPHYCSYFRFRGDNEDREPLEAPSADCPLLYNLLGCQTEDESLILDYEDLFWFLRGVLSPDGIPDILRDKLRKARSFFFVGFDFEKWYTQLLLQLLTFERSEHPKFVINTEIADSAARNFLINQFQLQFLDSGLDFFKKLQARLKARNLFRELKRKPAKDIKEESKRIQDCIAKDLLGEAAEALKQWFLGTRLQDQALFLQGRLQDWNRNHLQGVRNASEETVERNKIREALIQLHKEMI